MALTVLHQTPSAKVHCMRVKRKDVVVKESQITNTWLVCLAQLAKFIFKLLQSYKNHFMLWCS